MRSALHDASSLHDGDGVRPLHRAEPVRDDERRPPRISASSARCVSASLAASSADVASSRINTGASFSTARAMATRARRCPPLRRPPPAPASGAYPSARDSTNACAFAAFAARTTSGRVGDAPDAPDPPSRRREYSSPPLLFALSLRLVSPDGPPDPPLLLLPYAMFFFDGSREEGRGLLDERDRVEPLGGVAHVLGAAVPHRHAALGGFVESAQELRDGGLPRAARADGRERLPARNRQRAVAKDEVVRAGRATRATRSRPARPPPSLESNARTASRGRSRRRSRNLVVPNPRPKKRPKKRPCRRRYRVRSSAAGASSSRATSRSLLTAPTAAPRPAPGSCTAPARASAPSRRP